MGIHENYNKTFSRTAEAYNFFLKKALSLFPTPEHIQKKIFTETVNKGKQFKFKKGKHNLKKIF